MLTGMGVTNPNPAKGGRKLKKAKHYTIPKTLHKNEKKRASSMRNLSQSLKLVKRNATRESMQNDGPNQV